MAEALDVVAKVQGLLIEVDVVEAIQDEAKNAELRAALEPLAEPDFEVVMIGPDYQPNTLGGAGFDGFRDAWRDWTEAFETYSIQLDEVLEAGDKVLALVHQTGVTKTGGVEITTPAAAVWTVRDGKVARVEFHLDQDAARRAAGLATG
jgi:ketosteroid isomerase-like protein